MQACQSSPLRVVTSRDALPPSGDSAGHITLTRPHTALLLSTVAGGTALRGAYTGAIADQISKSSGKTDINSMHTAAVKQVQQTFSLNHDQIPELRHTLDKTLIMPKATPPDSHVAHAYGNDTGSSAVSPESLLVGAHNLNQSENDDGISARNTVTPIRDRQSSRYTCHLL